MLNHKHLFTAQVLPDCITRHTKNGRKEVLYCFSPFNEVRVKLKSLEEREGLNLDMFLCKVYFLSIFLHIKMKRCYHFLYLLTCLFSNGGVEATEPFVHAVSPCLIHKQNSHYLRFWEYNVKGKWNVGGTELIIMRSPTVKVSRLVLVTVWLHSCSLCYKVCDTFLSASKETKMWKMLLILRVSSDLFIFQSYLSLL